MAGSDEPLSEPEFRMVRDAMALFVGVVATNPALTLENLDRFIAQCEHSSAFGVFVDPSLWMRSHDQLQVMTDEARALRDFIAGIRERHPEVVDG